MLEPVLPTYSRASTTLLLGALLLTAVLPAAADTRFRVRLIKPTSAPMDKGVCEMRLQVNGETEISLRGDMVTLHTISGADAADRGSTCNEPLPTQDVRGFALEGKESRGELRLTAPPSAANDFQAVVHLRNTAPGDVRYHFRLTWQITLATLHGAPSAGPPGFVWNNATRYKTRGRGEASVGNVHVALLDVDAAIDLGGKVWVTFQTVGKVPLSFSGVLNARESGRLRADVVCDGPDWHVQGPMFLSVEDAHDRVNAITLDATDGHDRLHLEWKRR
jgi:hypothetical protein